MAAQAVDGNGCPLDDEVDLLTGGVAPEREPQQGVRTRVPAQRSQDV